MVHFMIDCFLDSMAQEQSVDQAVFVFVGDGSAHHSEWLESVSPTDWLLSCLSTVPLILLGTD